MGILRQVAEYLFIKKKDPTAPKTFNIKAMHFINRLSILLFLLAMIILAVKLLR
jgi:cob(I)alamin adenosyltransferase